MNSYDLNSLNPDFGRLAWEALVGADPARFGGFPAMLLVEQDPSARNRLLSLIAESAAAGGREVAVAEQAPPVRVGAPQAGWEAPAAERVRRWAEEPSPPRARLLVVPRLELTATSTSDLVRHLRSARDTYLLAGLTGLGEFALQDAFGPEDFPLVWRAGRVHVRFPAARA